MKNTVIRLAAFAAAALIVFSAPCYAAGGGRQSMPEELNGESGYELLPLLYSPEENREAVTVSAASAVLINADTGTIIYSKNPYERRAMASTTKIMTALLTAEAGDLDSKFTADSYAIQAEGTSMGLKQGDIVTRRALLYGMLLPSGNDAANAAAVSISGSMSEFAKLMNSKAAELGLNNTRYVNPSGLDADGHYTTAYDLALLTKAALENPTFAGICQKASAQVEFGNPPYLRTLSNSNKMLWQYEGCIGVKTGFTDNARRCLVSAAERNGVTLIAVTLNDPDDWLDHTKMLDYGFTQVRPTEILLPSPITVPVVGGISDSVNLTLSRSLTLPLSQKELQKVTFEIHTEPFLYAGFATGKIAGTAKIFLNGEYVATVNLTAENGVKRSEAPVGALERFWCGVRRFFTL
ncbi:MAG: D-alanyl-D-alanine carboxypeptidase [Firmicutes bacterium]|nr:D-alanyl-D-alanine carboxypeptidase [[Eubacterium] siraeum]MCM1487288.1 D-alanyl-D-alanine carboxypeptidase [Bacillota bacterium]